MKSKLLISVVIPVYNEIDNLQTLISRLQTAFSSGVAYELIFVDDRSSDGTLEYLQNTDDNHLRVLEKKGLQGKAYSLLEGFKEAKGDYIAMIDADLQYPPEAIERMITSYPEADIIVADRKDYQESRTRKTLSKSFRHIFGNLLFGLNNDIQSGLKVFRREVVEVISFTPKSGWTFDLEFLHRANQAGFVIKNYPITFAKRTDGNSKMSLFRQSIEIGSNALSVRLKRIFPKEIHSSNANTMIGAGVRYKKKMYVTHTHLPHSVSALQTFHLAQKIRWALIVVCIGLGLVLKTFLMLKILVACASVIYFLDVLFNLTLILKSLHKPKEIVVEKDAISALDEKMLPVYTILCPMYKEAHILPYFIQSIEKLNWPKNKLDVLILLEADDQESVSAIRKMDLPKYIRTIVVPESLPKTKPKACNYGLQFARGEYLVIYDAEDVPEVDQLKKAYIGFIRSPKEVICLQAKLNYFNLNQNLLTRFFTAEYSLWFDITLPGLQSLDTSIPLGGTSNHFRTADLIRLQGWDPFNVTEDADLGARLFAQGYKTAIIDSTTFEEANSRVKNWIRQRSRWIKGYMQTYLVHTRPNAELKNQKKIHALLFRLTIGGKISFILINPFLWLATIAYFTLYRFVGPAIESLYPSVVFYMALFSLVFGNFMFMYYFMVGVIKREQYGLVKYIFLIPLYWLLISIAGFMALYQLLFRPHYWEKTVHGLHLKPAEPAATKPTISVTPVVMTEAKQSVFAKLKVVYLSGGALVIAAVLSNLMNFVFNSYLGRNLTLENYALVSLMGSFLYIVNIPNNALNLATRYRSGFLTGRYGASSSYAFWRNIRLQTFLVGLCASIVWAFSSIFIRHFFDTDDIFPFLLFAPYFITAFVGSVDGGYLSGKLLFGYLALLSIIDPIIKLAIAVLAVTFHEPRYVYTTIPLSSLVTLLIGWLMVKKNKEVTKSTASIREVKYFPFKFFIASGFSGLSTMAFLSLDVILATHYLKPVEAGTYALLSLAGKMVYFLGNLANQFVVPIVSRNEGAKTSSKRALYIILLFTTLLALIGFLAFGVFGFISLPLLYGKRADAILPYVVFYAFAMFCFTVSRVIGQYYLVKKVYTFSLFSFLLTILQFLLIGFFHQSVVAIVFCMYLVAGVTLVGHLVLHLGIRTVKSLEQNIVDIFIKKDDEPPATNGLRILIFNWRDTKHKWAGGAEVYVHEIAKRLVKNGNSVTVFCGNDRHSSREQEMDGVTIIRRGGTFLVYFWALLYYHAKFRKNYDVIVDCENGIPFFTPLFTRKQVVLLIHHVHQEVFREHLPFMVSRFARFLEGTIMPFVYRNKQVITVSDSSRKDIIKLGFTNSNNISVVHNGINNDAFTPAAKTAMPLFTYLGRLKPYKNIDIAIKAFADVSATYKNARMAIIGDGESRKRLTKMTSTLGLKNKVRFYGKVTEKKKAQLLAKSWVVLQPSMSEGWGITVIEANASGTPVIASNVNGLKDSVVHRKTGILVKARDVASLTKSMRNIIDNKSFREELSDNAYAWSQRFSWDVSAGQFLAILTKAASEKKDYSIIPGYEIQRSNL